MVLAYSDTNHMCSLISSSHNVNQVPKVAYGVHDCESAFLSTSHVESWVIAKDDHGVSIGICFALTISHADSWVTEDPHGVSMGTSPYMHSPIKTQWRIMGYRNGFSLGLHGYLDFPMKSPWKTMIVKDTPW